MEWVQVLVALVGGGIGGTVLTRLWENRREDKLRFVHQKREAAAEYLAAAHRYYAKRVEWQEVVHMMQSRATAWKEEPDYEPGFALAGRDTHLYDTAMALRREVASEDLTMRTCEAKLWLLFSTPEVVIGVAMLSGHVRMAPTDPNAVADHAAALPGALGKFNRAVRTELGVPSVDSIKQSELDAAIDEAWDPTATKDSTP